jgi:hypothetical protein
MAGKGITPPACHGGFGEAAFVGRFAAGNRVNAAPPAGENPSKRIQSFLCDPS